MPRIRKQKFKPGQMVEAVETGAIVDEKGVTHFIRAGETRLRADHAAVKTTPQFFKELEPEFLPDPSDERSRKPAA